MLKSSESTTLRPGGPISCEGESLPVLTYTISVAEVFMFSAITWNRHRIHYDKDQAIREGHEGVLVQRGLIGNILCRYINDIWGYPDISTLHWKVVKGTLADSILTASGLIERSIKTSKGLEMNLSLSLLDDCNAPVCHASAVVRGNQPRPCSPCKPEKTSNPRDYE